MSSLSNRRSAANDAAGSGPAANAVSDLYTRVTAAVIASLEAGVPPWVCPWSRSSASGGSQLPVNATTGRPYRGINVLLLNARLWECGFTSNRWLTFNQAQAVGARVRKGSTGSTVVFFKMWEADASGAGDVPAIDDRKVIPLLRSFTVFNTDQVDGLPAAMAPVADPGVSGIAWNPLASAEALVTASGASIAHGGERAFYRPSDDHIQMPVRSAFASAEAYYGTLLHELTHWTGHESRCARVLQGRPHIEAYAFEELVAEMGAAFLCAHCGLLPAAGGEAPGLQHAAYIGSWLQALKNDRRLIFTASSLAQKAADFVLAPVLASAQISAQAPASEAV
ncbi:MAG TPA: zincin-like metallopeptidase domain-containing protein [Burkholderiaceae bacterium]|nr:zincin-like metallopeptidase domain-containing protein [Burkholderiaceae bacterium]